MIALSRRSLHLFLGMLATLLCVGCGLPQRAPSTETRANIWPFYSESRTDDGVTRRDIAGPFVTASDSEDGAEEFTIRPFYSYTYDPVKDEEEALALYPVGRWRKSYRPYGAKDDRVRKEQVFAFPFFYYSYFSPLPGESETDYYAPFPLIIGGDSTQDGEHFSFLPFAGTFKGILGKDEINYILFPLYAEMKRGEDTDWYLPWPLLRYGSGPNYSAFSVLPLFSYEQKDGKYERHTAAFPILHWGSENLDTAHPRHYWLMWPLAGRSWTDQTEAISLLALWPVVQSGWVDDADMFSIVSSSLFFPAFNYVHAKNTDTTIIDAPWPIFRWAEGDNYEEFRLWPLYARARIGDDYQYQVAWPFFWYFDQHEPNYDQQQFLAFPFFWSRFRQYTKEADGVIRDEADINLWPVFAYNQNIAEEWRFSFPNPIPFPNPLPYKGERFHRLYDEIFNILTIEGGPDSFSLEALWGAFNVHDDEESASYALHPFFQDELKKHNEPGIPRLSAHDKDEESFDFLYGLFGYRCTEEGWYTRLFWFFEIPYN